MDFIYLMDFSGLPSLQKGKTTRAIAKPYTRRNKRKAGEAMACRQSFCNVERLHCVSRRSPWSGIRWRESIFRVDYNAPLYIYMLHQYILKPEWLLIASRVCQRIILTQCPVELNSQIVSKSSIVLGVCFLSIEIF